MDNWTRHSTETLRDCRIFKLQRVTASSPTSSKRGDFFVLDGPDWVNVIALTRDEQIILVRQYRHGSDSVTIEVPSGMVDPGESPLDAAKRELREETGYAATAWTAIGRNRPNPAIQNNVCHVFLATDAVREGELMLDDREEIEVELAPLKSIPSRIVSGEIDHALVLNAFGFYFLHERGKGFA